MTSGPPPRRSSRIATNKNVASVAALMGYDYSKQGGRLSNVEYVRNFIFGNVATIIDGGRQRDVSDLADVWPPKPSDVPKTDVEVNKAFDTFLGQYNPGNPNWLEDFITTSLEQTYDNKESAIHNVIRVANAVTGETYTRDADVPPPAPPDDDDLDDANDESGETSGDEDGPPNSNKVEHPELLKVVQSVAEAHQYTRPNSLGGSYTKPRVVDGLQPPFSQGALDLLNAVYQFALEGGKKNEEAVVDACREFPWGPVYSTMFRILLSEYDKLINTNMIKAMNMSASYKELRDKILYHGSVPLVEAWQDFTSNVDSDESWTALIRASALEPYMPVETRGDTTAATNVQHLLDKLSEVRTRKGEAINWEKMEGDIYNASAKALTYGGLNLVGFGMGGTSLENAYKAFSDGTSALEDFNESVLKLVETNRDGEDFLRLYTALMYVSKKLKIEWKFADQPAHVRLLGKLIPQYEEWVGTHRLQAKGAKYDPIINALRYASLRAFGATLTPLESLLADSKRTGSKVDISLSKEQISSLLVKCKEAVTEAKENKHYKEFTGEGRWGFPSDVEAALDKIKLGGANPDDGSSDGGGGGGGNDDDDDDDDDGSGRGGGGGGSDDDDDGRDGSDDGSDDGVSDLVELLKRIDVKAQAARLEPMNIPYAMSIATLERHELDDLLAWFYEAIDVDIDLDDDEKTAWDEVLDDAENRLLQEFPPTNAEETRARASEVLARFPSHWNFDTVARDSVAAIAKLYDATYDEENLERITGVLDTFYTYRIVLPYATEWALDVVLRETENERYNNDPPSPDDDQEELERRADNAIRLIDRYRALPDWVKPAAAKIVEWYEKAGSDIASMSHDQLSAGHDMITALIRDLGGDDEVARWLSKEGAWALRHVLKEMHAHDPELAATSTGGSTDDHASVAEVLRTIVGGKPPAPPVLHDSIRGMASNILTWYPNDMSGLTVHDLEAKHAMIAAFLTDLPTRGIVLDARVARAFTTVRDDLRMLTLRKSTAAVVTAAAATRHATSSSSSSRRHGRSPVVVFTGPFDERQEELGVVSMPIVALGVPKNLDRNDNITFDDLKEIHARLNLIHPTNGGGGRPLDARTLYNQITSRRTTTTA